MSRPFWITANANSGKSSLAFAAQKRFPNICVLDGDECRETICKGLGLSMEDRWSNCLRIASLADLLAKQGHPVVVSVIAPYVDLREAIDKMCNPFWIYLKRELPERENYPYEPPKEPDLIIYNREGKLEQAIEHFCLFLQKTPYYDKRFRPQTGNA